MIASELVHAVLPGTVLAHAEDDKLHTCPEVADSARVRLVALAGEAGGRWSETTAWLLRRLAQAKAAAEPLALRLATGRALEAQWWALLAVAAQDALASTLLGDAPTFSTAPLRPFLNAPTCSWTAGRRRRRTGCPHASWPTAGRWRGLEHRRLREKLRNLSIIGCGPTEIVAAMGRSR